MAKGKKKVAKKKAHKKPPGKGGKVPRHITYARGVEHEEKISFSTYYELYQSSGAPAAISIALLTEYLFQYRNSAGNYNPIPLSITPTDFTRMMNLYDLYCVDRVDINYISYCPAEYAGDVASYWTGGAGVGIVYLENDHDDDALITTEAQALNKGKGRSLFKAFKHTLTNHPDRRMKWFNTSMNDPSSVPVTSLTITDQIQNRSSIKIYAPLIPNNVAIGRLYITYDVRFKSLRTV